MPERRRKYTPEFKDEAAKMVIETSRPIAEIAREIHVHEGTLGNWVANYRKNHAGEEPPLSITERARLRGSYSAGSGREWLLSCLWRLRSVGLIFAGWF